MIAVFQNLSRKIGVIVGDTFRSDPINRCFVVTKEIAADELGCNSDNVAFVSSFDVRMVYVATIEHANGANYYSSQTEDGLYIQLYAYVKEWWNTVFDTSDDDLKLIDDPFQAVMMYFEGNGRETLNVGRAELW